MIADEVIDIFLYGMFMGIFAFALGMFAKHLSDSK